MSYICLLRQNVIITIQKIKTKVEIYLHSLNTLTFYIIFPQLQKYCILLRNFVNMTRKQKSPSSHWTTSWQLCAFSLSRHTYFL